LLARAHAAFVGGQIPGGAARCRIPAGWQIRATCEALSIKVNAAMRLDDADALLDGLQRLHALRPDDAAIRRNLATTLNRRGNRALELFRYGDAESQWRAALQVHAEHREARFNLAGWLRRSRSMDRRTRRCTSRCSRNNTIPAVERRVSPSACAHEGRREDAASTVAFAHVPDVDADVPWRGDLHRGTGAVRSTWRSAHWISARGCP
jgi:hypothetical protein